MRAAIYNQAEHKVVVQERPTPSFGEQEVLVRLHAASLNHREVKIISGRFDQYFTNDSELILGSDGAGVIEQVGASVTRWKVGDEVLIDSTYYSKNTVVGTPPDAHGTLATYINIHEENVVRKPSAFSMEEGATLALALGTAWNTVVTHGKLQSGETVLIHGIGGGVALFALQLALAKGASRIIVTSSSEAKLARARELGATDTIHYATEDVAQRVSELTDGQGANVIVDGIGGATFASNLLAAAPQGRIVSYGFTGIGSNQDEFPLTAEAIIKLYGKGLQFSTAGVHRDQGELIAALAACETSGQRPVISSVYNLEDIESAYQELRTGSQFGKIVIKLP